MKGITAGAASVTILFVAILGTTTGTASLNQPTPPDGCPTYPPNGSKPSRSKVADIPPAYLQLYAQAGSKYGLPWHVLAAVGATESDHGRSKLPGIRSGENHAGAGGPMQFLPPTWATFRVDGSGDGRTDRYDPADAIPAAARYLKHNGAPAKMRTALYLYNHSMAYVNQVLDRARQYAKWGGSIRTAPTTSCGGAQPLTSPSGAVGKIIAFAMAQRGKRYSFGATGPNAWDCSSLVQAAYRAAGYSIPRNTFGQWPFGTRLPKGSEQPGDLVFFNSGPNTSASHPGHVGLVIAPGKMVAARCANCTPNIGVQSYKRADWMGVTRPLLRLSRTR